MLDRLLVPTGSAANLPDRPTDDKLGLADKKEGVKELASLLPRLFDLQGRLWGESKRAVLVVLQAMDASGKDGTIRHVFSGVNPQGVQVTSFKVPSERELSQDYLWRAHANAPARGEIGIFNRSHYEDVLAAGPRLVPERQWRRRYRHIREFERCWPTRAPSSQDPPAHLARGAARAAPGSSRRSGAGVEVPRRRPRRPQAWDDYQAAYEDAITETNSRFAPWYVVPADRKWVRNVAVSRILVHTLEKMAPQYPPSAENLEGVTVV
jgi:polyphosphate kinase 2 (PPK2 family)